MSDDTIKKIRNKAKRIKVASTDDPRKELRRLCNQHRALTKAAVAIENMARDKKNRETGEPIPNRLPEDAREALIAQAKETSKRAAHLEPLLLRELRKVPLWNLWLRDVAGMGPKIAAYLVTMIDIRDRPDGRPLKPSQLRRYVGLGLTNGARDVMSVETRWNAELKMRLYQWAVSLRTNQRHGMNKYQRRWDEAKHRCATVTNPDWSKGRIDAKGRRKATDLFVDDLYTVWRAIEGLPVWPTFRDVAATYGHDGRMNVNEPEMLTIDEALRRVGDCGWQKPALAAE